MSSGNSGGGGRGGNLSEAIGSAGGEGSEAIGSPPLARALLQGAGKGDTGPPSPRAREGRECVWGSGVVTPLQPLQTLVALEVEAVTKALHGSYEALQTRIEHRRIKPSGGGPWGSGPV